MKKYSDFVSYPIGLTIVEEAVAPEGEDGDEIPDAIDVTPGEPTERSVDGPLNSMKAI